MSGHKASPNKYRKDEVICCTPPDPGKVRLPINSRRDSRTYTNSWRLTSRLLNKDWVLEEIKKEIKTNPRHK